MALTVEEYIAAFCPPMVTSGSMPVFIEIASGRVSETFFGDNYNEALAYMAMHQYTVSVTRTDGTAGLITGKTEGRTSTRYWNSSEKGAYSELNMTTYGKKYLSLIHSISPAVSVGDPNVL